MQEYQVGLTVPVPGTLQEAKNVWIVLDQVCRKPTLMCGNPGAIQSRGFGYKSLAARQLLQDHQREGTAIIEIGSGNVPDLLFGKGRAGDYRTLRWAA